MELSWHETKQGSDNTLSLTTVSCFAEFRVMQSYTRDKAAIVDGNFRSLQSVHKMNDLWVQAVSATGFDLTNHSTEFGWSLCVISVHFEPVTITHT
jgi:hypothetical protein